MNVTLEKKGNVDAIIKVSVDPADYADKVKKELKRFADTHVIPGFRKGHVPMDQLRRRFGKGVKSEVINDMVYREVVKYIQDNKLQILGEPMPVEVKEIGLDDVDYTFEYEVGLSPVLDVKLDKSVTIPYYTIGVTDEMIDEQDKAMRDRFGAQVPGDTVDERALVKGAIMELNEDGTVKESEDAIQVINGIVAPFHFTDKDEAAKFMGKHVNDKVVFNPAKTCDGNATELSSMLNIDKDRTASVKGDFEMAISEIIVHRPAEHDQEFFDNVFGKDKVHNEEEYKKAVTDMIAASLRGNSEQLFARDAQDYLIKKNEGAQLPDEFLKKWLKARNENIDEATFDDEYAQMRKSILWQIIKGDVAEALNVKLTEEDMLEYAKVVARQQFAQYGMTNLDDETITDYAKRILENKEYRNNIVETVSDGKLFATIRNTVTLDDKTVTVDEFKEIAQAK